MSNITSTLAKRLRASSVSLLNTPTQRTVFPKSLNADAVKQLAVDWEPDVNLEDLDLKLMTQDNNNKDQDIAYVATYSAFDPCATHPFLLSSALPLSVSDLAGDVSPVSTSDLKIKTQSTTSIANPGVQTPSTSSSLHHAIEVQQSVPAPTPDKFRPWPYSLPKVLQPQVGTTYGLMHGDGGSDGGVAKVKLGIIQKVLYGVPEPREEDGGSE